MIAIYLWINPLLFKEIKLWIISKNIWLSIRSNNLLDGYKTNEQNFVFFQAGQHPGQEGQEEGPWEAVGGSQVIF